MYNVMNVWVQANKQANNNKQQQQQQQQQQKQK